MASGGYLGYTTILKWNGTAIAEIKGDIPHPTITADKVDFTNRDSSSQWEESKPGMKHGGEITIEGNYLPGDEAQAAAIADFLSGTAREVIIEDTTAGFSWTFDAWVSSRGGASPDKNGPISFTLTLTITGVPVYAATASTGLTDPWFAISESAVVVPDEAGDAYEYVATVLTGVTSVTVTPTATSGVITIDGNVVATGEASSAITLGDAGTVTEITIVVKETGKTAKTYTIWLARAAS